MIDRAKVVLGLAVGGWTKKNSPKMLQTKMKTARPPMNGRKRLPMPWPTTSSISVVEAGEQQLEHLLQLAEAPRPTAAG